MRKKVTRNEIILILIALIGLFVLSVLKIYDCYDINGCSYSGKGYKTRIKEIRTGNYGIQEQLPGDYEKYYDTKQ